LPALLVAPLRPLIIVIALLLWLLGWLLGWLLHYPTIIKCRPLTLRLTVSRLLLRRCYGLRLRVGYGLCLRICDRLLLIALLILIWPAPTLIAAITLLVTLVSRWLIGRCSYRRITLVNRGLINRLRLRVCNRLLLVALLILIRPAPSLIAAITLLITLVSGRVISWLLIDRLLIYRRLLVTLVGGPLAIRIVAPLRVVLPNRPVLYISRRGFHHLVLVGLPDIGAVHGEPTSAQ